MPNDEWRSPKRERSRARPRRGAIPRQAGSGPVRAGSTMTGPRRSGGRPGANAWTTRRSSSATAGRSSGSSRGGTAWRRRCRARPRRRRFRRRSCAWRRWRHRRAWGRSCGRNRRSCRRRMPRNSGHSGFTMSSWFQPICGIFSPSCAVEADDLALEDAQPGGATVELLALLEQRLVADADAEERTAGLDELARGLQQRLLVERLDAIVERADARQHDGPRVGHFLGLPGDAHVCPDLEQRLVDAAQVAGAVVNQSNHGRRIVRRRGSGRGNAEDTPQGRADFFNVIRPSPCLLVVIGRDTPDTRRIRTAYTP